MCAEVRACGSSLWVDSLSSERVSKVTAAEGENEEVGLEVCGERGK